MAVSILAGLTSIPFKDAKELSVELVIFIQKYIPFFAKTTSRLLKKMDSENKMHQEQINEFSGIARILQYYVERNTRGGTMNNNIPDLLISSGLLRDFVHAFLKFGTLEEGCRRFLLLCSCKFEKLSLFLQQVPRFMETIQSQEYQDKFPSEAAVWNINFSTNPVPNLKDSNPQAFDLLDKILIGNMEDPKSFRKVMDMLKMLSLFSNTPSARILLGTKESPLAQRLWELQSKVNKLKLPTSENQNEEEKMRDTKATVQLLLKSLLEVGKAD